MANSLLTPTMVTREALRVLHQKLNFIGTIDRQYDSSFAVQGAKIGSTLKIREPNQYTVRTGKVANVQDTSETSSTLTLATQKGVDTTFSAADLTLSMDDFSSRVLEPAMSVLAANIESDALSMYKNVYSQSNNVGSSATFAKILAGRKKLIDNLAGSTNLVCNLDTQANVDLVDALKGLYQDSSEISKQYREGAIGRGAGFMFYENTLMPRHTSGSDDGTGDYLTNDATAQTGSTLTVDTGTGTFKEGDIITIAGVNRVHPETKADTGQLMQFVITADASASATSLSISPAIVASGATQNVTNGAANNQAITKVGGASASYDISLAYAKDAFTFVTADLELPRGVHFAAREVMDGVSMRVISDYDVVNDDFITRIDVLYGYLAQRPQLACRLANN